MNKQLDWRLRLNKERYANGHLNFAVVVDFIEKLLISEKQLSVTETLDKTLKEQVSVTYTKDGGLGLAVPCSKIYELRQQLETLKGEK